MFELAVNLSVDTPRDTPLPPSPIRSRHQVKRCAYRSPLAFSCQIIACCPPSKPPTPLPTAVTPRTVADYKLLYKPTSGHCVHQIASRHQFSLISSAVNRPCRSGQQQFSSFFSLNFVAGNSSNSCA